MPEGDYKLKMAAISGASHAIRFREKNPRTTEGEVIKHVTEKIEEIISEIDGEEDF
ncbi:MAG: hypothetical protein ABIG28_03665 [archaeon]